MLLISRASWTDRFLPHSATLLISSPSWSDRFYPIQLRFSYPALPEQTDFSKLFFHTQPFLNRPTLSNPAALFISSPSWIDRFFPILFPYAPAEVRTRVAWLKAARPNRLSCTNYIAMSIATFASNLQAMCKKCTKTLNSPNITRFLAPTLTPKYQKAQKSANYLT